MLYEQRALALHSDEANYYRYKIVKPFVVDSGKAAPWFDRVGGGTQYFSGENKILNKKGELIDATVENLLDNNYIREID
nr:TNT domain-containing protein [Listeria weihenstephanensis]